MTDSTATYNQVVSEVEGLHDFFMDWYAGRCPRDQAVFANGAGSRMIDGFTIVMPGGGFLSRDEILPLIENGYGINDRFKIKIRNVQVLHETADIVLASYEEWQREAVNSTPPENGRLSSALFLRDPSRDSGLIWRHVHETWLPADVMAAGPYDF